MKAPSRRLFAPVSAGALALGLAVGLALPLLPPLLAEGPPPAQRPEGFVGVLVAPEGMTGLVVSAERDGTALDTRLPRPLAMPDGSTLFLWAIEPSGAVAPGLMRMMRPWLFDQ